MFLFILITLILYQNVFYHISRWHLHSKIIGTSVYCPVFNCSGGRMARMMGACHTADWLFFLHMIHPSSWGKGFLFPPPLGIIVYERHTQIIVDERTNPDSRCLAEIEGSRDCRFRRHP